MTYVTTGMVPSLSEDDDSEDDTLQLSFCHGWRGYLLTPVFDPKHPIPDRPQFTAYRALLDSERVTCSLTAESFPCLNGHWVRQALHVDHIHYLRILPPSVPQRVLLGLVSAGVTLDLISVHKEAVDRNFVQWMDRVIGYIQIYMDGQMVFWAPDPSRLPHRPIGSTASQSSS
jgi:diadenosine tetraphosphatase ApaH/serine/threonine PP2A family protein phosphatase